MRMEMLNYVTRCWHEEESENRGTRIDQSNSGPTRQMWLPFPHRLEACPSHARAT